VTQAPFSDALRRFSCHQDATGALGATGVLCKSMVPGRLQGTLGRRIFVPDIANLGSCKLLDPSVELGEVHVVSAV